MGEIIKFQHEALNGKIVNEQPDFDILYPKTSADMVEGLTAAIQALLTGDTKIQSITLTPGTASAGPKITITHTDGTSVVSSTLNLASTNAYGVTKLNSATNSTSTTEAATPSAVKQAYGLATTANNAANSAYAAITNLLDDIDGKLLKVAMFNDLEVLKRAVSLDLGGKVTADNIISATAFSKDEKGFYVVTDGVTFAIVSGKLQVNSTAKTVNFVRVVYMYSMD